MKSIILTKPPPAALAIFLLAFCGLYLFIQLLGYTFFPVNSYVLNTISAAIVVWLTVRCKRNESEKTKVNIVLPALLPLIAIFFIIIKWIATDISAEEIFLYAGITFLCSMIIFFSCVRGKAVKIAWGIVYILLLALVSFFLLINLFFSTFFNLSNNTVVKSQMSPNSIYLAQVIENCQGALGGRTLVTVTRRSNLNLLVGELRRDSQTVYSGRWNESEGMILRWENDETLHIRGERVSMTWTSG